jgi:DNA-directed RNA polymerase specialized sigma24 family protein
MDSTVASQAEVVLIDGAADGSGFEAFFAARYVELVRAMYAMTRSLTDAEDIAQEALCKCFERWGRVSSMTLPRGICIGLPSI